MMKLIKSKSFHIAFVVDNAAINRIVNVLKEASNELELSITCNDGTVIDFESSDELLSFPNTKPKIINSVKIRTPWGSQLRIDLKLSNNKYTPVHYEISGEEEKVINFMTKIEEYIQSIRQWYSKLTFIDFRYIFLLFYLLVFTIVYVYSILYMGFLDNPINKTLTGKDLLLRDIMILFPLVLLFFGWLFNFLKIILLPIGIFTIGDGLKRYSGLVQLRYTFTFIVLTIIISIIIDLIF